MRRQITCVKVDSIILMALKTSQSSVGGLAQYLEVNVGSEELASTMLECREFKRVSSVVQVLSRMIMSFIGSWVKSSLIDIPSSSRKRKND